MGISVKVIYRKIDLKPNSHDRFEKTSFGLNWQSKLQRPLKIAFETALRLMF